MGAGAGFGESPPLRLLLTPPALTMVTLSRGRWPWGCSGCRSRGKRCRWVKNVLIPPVPSLGGENPGG